MDSANIMFFLISATIQFQECYIMRLKYENVRTHDNYFYST